MKMGVPEFKLKVKPQEFSSLLTSYQSNKRQMDKERDAFDAGKRIVAKDFSQRNLQPIISWKSPRSKNLVEGNEEPEVRDTLRLAIDAKTDRAAIAVLTGLCGVQIPVGSAILTVVDPGRFTVIDYRALHALSVKQSLPTVDLYLEYLKYCRRTAPAYGLSLRQFDQVLWQWSKDRDSKKASGRRHNHT